MKTLLALSRHQQKRIVEKREESQLKRKRRLTAEQGNGSSSSSSTLPSCTLTAQQKRRIDENRRDAEQRRSRRRLTSKTTVPFDPFGEILDGDFIDDTSDRRNTLDIVEHPYPPEEPSGNSSNTQPACKPTSKLAKHWISSARLQQVKSNANETWQRHLGNSARVLQLTGNMPNILECYSEEAPPPRFKIHPSHLTMAVRSIVHCKMCGYWAAKKSQNLRVACPGKPPHADGTHKLRRMLAGLHPDVKVKMWPDGHDARVPSRPISVDWSSGS